MKFKKITNWLFIFLIWLVIGFLSSLQAYYYRNLVAPRFSFAETVVYDTTFYILWAFLTPIVIMISRRSRIEITHLFQPLCVHLTAGIVIGFFQRGLFNFIFMFAERSEEHPFDAIRLFNQTFGTFDVSVMIYFAVVFVNHTIDYYRRLQEQVVHAAKLKTELVNAQLDALRGQLQPHFLFNTLNAIAVLIEENPFAARKTVNLLSDLLRMTLEHQQEREVPLSREMEFITRYLQIYEVRFGSRLTVDIRVDTDTNDLLVPYLILQPIVENALRHGIEKIPGVGIIRMKAFRNDGFLRLVVSDSGPGLSNPEMQCVINSGVGLRNTRNRLEHHYGEQGRLDITDSNLGGLEVIISIPFHRQGDPNIKSGISV